MHISIISLSLAASLWASSAHALTSPPATGGFITTAASAPVWQASNKGAHKAGAKSHKPKKAKRGGGGKITFHPGSSESRGERDSRLLRECKGRPNSGACLGYAS